jgi:hypothetical protein
VMCAACKPSFLYMSECTSATTGRLHNVVCASDARKQFRKAASRRPEKPRLNPLGPGPSRRVDANS